MRYEAGGSQVGYRHRRPGECSMGIIQAVFEHGVFRPLDTVDLPEHSRVEFVPNVISPAPLKSDALAETYTILSERYDGGDLAVDDGRNQESIYAILSKSCSSGRHDVAERHSKHQP